MINMRKITFFIAFLFSVTQLWSQNETVSSKKEKSNEDRNFRIPLIGESAPSFTAETTTGELNFPSDYVRKWKILFSHPQDFTPVCSSEILELAYNQDAFDKLDVKLVVVSVDPLDSHKEWKKALEELNYKDREKVKINFPIVSDENLKISKKYGMIHPASNSTKAVRGVFIIDPSDIIQAVYFVGRSTDELLRVVSALQTTAVAKVMTPANWKSGDDLLVPFLPKTELADNKVAPEGYYNTAWFMCFKRGK
jgi:peroxiredoxin (alkyl hydroperoxide reductase subunit C)